VRYLTQIFYQNYSGYFTVKIILTAITVKYFREAFSVFWFSATVSKLSRVSKTTAVMIAVFWFRINILQERRHISTPSPHETLHGALKVQLL
jgi:hypothetical protein